MSGEPAIVFEKREQKELFFEWMREHPTGFVINFPYNGITANSRIRYHRSGCSVLLKKSFPTEAWHKVCADRLPVLVKWAEDRERMENSPKIQPCARCGG